EGQVVDVGVIVAVEVQAEATDITGDANVGLEGGGGGGARVVVVGGTDIEGPGVVDREGVAGDEVDLVVDDASNGVLGEGGPDDAVEVTIGHLEGGVEGNVGLLNTTEDVFRGDGVVEGQGVGRSGFLLRGGKGNARESREGNGSLFHDVVCLWFVGLPPFSKRRPKEQATLKWQAAIHRNSLHDSC